MTTLGQVCYINQKRKLSGNQAGVRTGWWSGENTGIRDSRVCFISDSAFNILTNYVSFGMPLTLSDSASSAVKWEGCTRRLMKSSTASSVTRILCVLFYHAKLYRSPQTECFLVLKEETPNTNNSTWRTSSSFSHFLSICFNYRQFERELVCFKKRNNFQANVLLTGPLTAFHTATEDWGMKTTLVPFSFFRVSVNQS